MSEEKLLDRVALDGLWPPGPQWAPRVRVKDGVIGMWGRPQNWVATTRILIIDVLNRE